MRLRCVAPYRNAGAVYTPGEIIEADPARIEWLLRDAPGCFVVDLPVEPRAGEPVNDRLLDGAPNRAPAPKRRR